MGIHGQGLSLLEVLGVESQDTIHAWTRFCWSSIDLIRRELVKRRVQDNPVQ